jgi:hypothetical protein
MIGMEPQIDMEQIGMVPQIDMEEIGMVPQIDMEAQIALEALEAIDMVIHIRKGVFPQTDLEVLNRDMVNHI